MNYCLVKRLLLFSLLQEGGKRRMEKQKCLNCQSEDMKDIELKIEYENKSGDYNESYGYDTYETEIYYSSGRGYYSSKNYITALKCEDCGFIMMFG
jgi:hypothetical protein